MNMGDGVLLQNKKGCASRHSCVFLENKKYQKKNKSNLFLSWVD